MPKLDYESEYNARSRLTDSVEISLRWTSQSAAARAVLSGERDLPYGSGERQAYDLFRPRGVDVAVASYSLCPQVRLKTIIAELRVCAADLWNRTARRPLVVGHDAGAHLAATLVATDWSQWPGVPPALTPSGYGISGVYELEPLLGTSLNDTLRLSPGEARQVSPILWPSPPPGRRFVACVGGNETQERMRQALDLTATWSRAGGRRGMRDCPVHQPSHGSRRAHPALQRHAGPNRDACRQPGLNRSHAQSAFKRVVTPR